MSPKPDVTTVSPIIISASRGIFTMRGCRGEAACPSKTAATLDSGRCTQGAPTALRGSKSNRIGAVCAYTLLTLPTTPCAVTTAMSLVTPSSAPRLTVSEFVQEDGASLAMTFAISRSTVASWLYNPAVPSSECSPPALPPVASAPGAIAPLPLLAADCHHTHSKDR